ncbi:MAG: OmpA family protein [Chlorobi bacterium]|nr:OmpA family protein [Chlorobiota bacterium]
MKLFFTILTLLLISFSGIKLSAQISSRNYFGLEAGFNYSVLNADSGFIFPYSIPSQDFNSALGFNKLGGGYGFVGGFTLDYAINKSFGLIIKALYQRRSTSNTEQFLTKVEDFSTGTSDIATVENQYTASSDYINGDLLLKISLSPDAWYGYGGVNLASILSNKFSGKSTIKSSVSGTVQFKSPTQGFLGTEMIIPEQEALNFYNNIHTSIKLGVGNYISIGESGTVITPELSVNVPITELLSTNSITILNKNLGLPPANLTSAAFTVGIKFPFGDNKNKPEDKINNDPVGKNSNGYSNTNDNNNLKGNVKDAKTGKPIPSEMSIVDLNTGEVIENSSTDQNGKYNANVTKKGKYSITATSNGYLFNSSLFEVDDNGKIIRKGNGDILLMSADERGKTTLLVFFDTDKSTLQRSSYPELNRAAQFLKSNPNLNIEIAGHTDNKGSMDYNKDLSKRRAQTVSNYLINKGVNASQLVQTGYGFDYPVNTNETEEGRADNRRVEFVVKK